MVVFIINTVLLVSSIGLIVYDYLYTKNSKNNIDARIKRFIFGGIEILIIGTVLVALSIIGSKELDVEVEPIILIFMIVIAVIAYVVLLLLWNNMFKNIQKYFSKKSVSQQKYKLKSISIYGLVYSFGILFYLIYLVVIFK